MCRAVELHPAGCGAERAGWGHGSTAQHPAEKRHAAASLWEGSKPEEDIVVRNVVTFRCISKGEVAGNNFKNIYAQSVQLR